MLAGSLGGAAMQSQGSREWQGFQAREEMAIKLSSSVGCLVVTASGHLKALPYAVFFAPVAAW